MGRKKSPARVEWADRPQEHTLLTQYFIRFFSDLGQMFPTRIEAAREARASALRRVHLGFRSLGSYTGAELLERAAARDSL